ncbi:protein phosphatase Slingshot homolog 3 [Wyeomyia smithii]|uniref:protein phosphatase Slingshot homolog 3 n=1 Tax=Wyeomyia smithii TaxID=174621 RepID=UPI002467DE3C|nr:protein phosphatase Slingshot homolog 3 [Wyeomyia smithii]
MGNGMNKVMPGLYVGNYRDSKDYQQLDRFQITHIVSIHDSPRRFHSDKHYLCVMAADTPDQNLSQYFSVCNDFIHAARLKDGNVLIHCLAGMSRSVTVAVAYIMSVTPLSWKEALKVVRAGRAIANPNLGFQNQLQEFETNKLLEERKRLKERFPSLALEENDREQCSLALDNFEILLENKGVCEGQCKFGKDCPTGICRSESRGLRRKASPPSPKKQYNLSSSPSTSSQLSVRSSTAPQSCPSSPRFSKASGGAGGSKTPSNPRSAGEYAAEIDIGELGELRRSSSIVSTFRPRSSPAGLYSYTGSAPPSIHGSRVDLAGSVKNTGSAIYLGTSSPPGGAFPGVSRRVSLRSTPKSTPKSTPDSSPKASPKRTLSAKAPSKPPASNTNTGSTAKLDRIDTSPCPSSNASPAKKNGSSKITTTTANAKPTVTSVCSSITNSSSSTSSSTNAIANTTSITVSTSTKPTVKTSSSKQSAPLVEKISTGKSSKK